MRTCLETEAERLLGHLHARAGRADLGDVRAAVEAFAADSPGGFALLFEGTVSDVRRRLELRLADLAGCSAVDAAALLGGAAAAVSRARADAA